ncbi:transporter substrate-binding domain-containing protein [Virgibacillus dakarensis]|uniref:Arginine-binding extracellular protein ArtP n=1 Tax=Lentibacillus populi TaxID=1827502 RepID=A0A9W5TXY5_9BACI|nr:MULTISPECIES: ABC transporter substrate-binding protein [Bacillaceae]MBT2214755.1 ABC transporter substrate-binding protein [Virgibacillus dakarensis]MTW85573.1 transporter substrate-binding domain-containing protein [Virgibacillus dakarensis]GGB44276.1 arginine-binding extracellular protein ArtP [Lentibacillus populi]
MKLSIRKLLVFVLLISLLAACGTSEQGKTDAAAKDGSDKKVLKMATSADFPPFESRNPNGEFEGFDIDLANLIADELGYKLKIEDMKFEGLIGSLQADRVDMVMAGMSATKDRRKNVAFSNAYNRSGEMFISQPDNKIDDLASLKGKTVGVQLGTIQEEGAKKLSEEYGFEVKKVDDSKILIQELNSNRIDVAYMDKTVAVGYIEAQGLAGFDDPTTSSPGMGIAFPKDSDLVDDVNKVLEKLEENGKLQELKEKWLSDYQEIDS